MAAIVVPFRGATGKSRLAAIPARARRRLGLAMLGDVVAACTCAGRTIVVTSDRAAAKTAKELGAAVAGDPGGGQGAAVASALASAPAGRVLVVNADLPAVVPHDVRALEAATPPGGIAIVIAGDGTTNALGLARADLFAPLYGPGSAERFRAHAESLAVDFVEASIPTLIEDVDEPGDLERMGLGVGPRTLAEAASLAELVSA
jgi:2-phospho-L-lactate guanylyltransferase